MGQMPNAMPANNMVAPGSSVPSPLVPSAGGGMAGAVGKTIAPMVESPYAPGALIPDPNHPGQLISKGDAQTVASAQQAIQGISNLKPILQDISKGAEKWLAPGMQGKLKAAQAVNWAQQNVGNVGGVMNTLMNQTGLTTKDLSDFAGWQADQQKSVETLMKARQWPQDAAAIGKVSQIIQPIPVEGKEYGDRVTREMAQLENQLLPNYQQSLGGGFTLPTQNQQASNKNAQPNVIATATVDNKTYEKHSDGKWYPK